LLGSFDYSNKVLPVAPGSSPTLHSDHTATITIDGAREPAPFDAGLFSYQFRVIPGPVKDSHYAPSDPAGAAGTPHYGVGSFHHLTPEDYVLAVPTPLVIDYHDTDIDGFAEASLAMYKWNASTRDWDKVGGTLDPVANTVTANIQAFGVYTLAPTMPARDIPLTYTDAGTTGAQESQTQRFHVTSGPLVMNDGTPVPSGTVYTIHSLVGGGADLTDFGTILGTDADPARDGFQIVVSGGSFSFDVEYPSPFGLYFPGRVAVYSAVGTAYGQTVLVKP
jgi:hypothetical protein